MRRDDFISSSFELRIEPVSHKNVVWMAFGKYILPLRQSIRGFTNLSQLMPNTISTSGSSFETIKLIFLITPMIDTGVERTRPLERAFSPLPNSKVS